MRSLICTLNEAVIADEDGVWKTTQPVCYIQHTRGGRQLLFAKLINFFIDKSVHTLSGTHD